MAKVYQTAGHTNRRLLDKYEFDTTKLHFTGRLPYDQYLKVLRASSVHIYLTRPFVLSWSMLEAMSTGCLLVASDTQPVREVIENGANGCLVEFFDAFQIADHVEDALDNRNKMDKIRHKRPANDY